MKTAAEFAREYPLTFEPVPQDEGGGFYAYAAAFPGLLGNGATRDEAAEDLLGVLVDAIETRISDGVSLPDATEERFEYSGKLNLRIGKSLHALLAQRAKADGISINTLITQLVAYGLGAKEAQGHSQPQNIIYVNCVPERISAYKQLEAESWKLSAAWQSPARKEEYSFYEN